jgi:glycosidase
VPPSLRRDTATLDRGTNDNRDRARTPMPWDASPGQGFSTPGATPWLPLSTQARNVADQRADPGSVLWLCKRLLALRRAELGGGVADYSRLPAPEDIWAYRAGSLLVAANFSGRPADLPAAVSATAGEVLLTTSGATPASPPAVLGPWEGIIARLSSRGPTRNGRNMR